MSGDVVVVGGSVGGLASALALARDGHRVTVLERDVLPASTDPEDAFQAERDGAPQAHHTHGFLARTALELRRRFPDVLEELLGVGCTTLPTTANLGKPRPGDEDLSILVVRRTTFEWILRRAVVREPGIELRDGVSVAGLEAGDGGDGPPVVTGVGLQDGSVVPADVVVVATGRRAGLKRWLERIGVGLEETIHESGLMYLTRWYRLDPGFDMTQAPRLGGNLGFVKYLAVPGDGQTFSVSLAIERDDAELRAALGRPDGFDHACRVLPGPDVFFAGGDIEPLSPLRTIGGLLNRTRRFVDEGRPLVLGLHAVGDAHTCTNPLYGRGVSLALVQGLALADAVRGHPDDAEARALAYEAACEREVRPWYEMSVQSDAMGADPAGVPSRAPRPDGERSEAGRMMATIFSKGAADPVIGRAILRVVNLLTTPADLMSDSEVVAAAARLASDPAPPPPPPPEGPSREELLAGLAARSGAAPTLEEETV